MDLPTRGDFLFASLFAIALGSVAVLAVAAIPLVARHRDPARTQIAVQTAGALEASAPPSSPPPTTAQPDAHLVGVYNASTGTMQLYVNGALAGTSTNTTPWANSGAF